jgi:membrane-associated HD superfamily phosphohydrolase
MSIGTILLLIVGLLVLFGAGQRVLDRLRLTDREAILFIALIIAGGFLPDISITRDFAFNVGGALIPLALCLWLFFRADTAMERGRAILSPIVTAVAVYALGRALPADPAEMAVDPNYIYGVAAGVIAFLFGRSRRCAFISGVLGVMLSNVATWLTVRMNGLSQRLVLGGAGAYDVIVISGLVAVLLAELIGELLERAARGQRRPARAFHGGDFEGRRG